MSNAGVFQWIRDAVRRSVLLGFSDAVEQLGAPNESAELHPQIAASLRQIAPAIEHQPAPSRPSAARPERKRLGRSLEQIRDSTTKPGS